MAQASGTSDGTNSEARFDHPNGLVADPTGNLYLGDRYNHVIRRISPSGTNWIVTTIAGQTRTYGNSDGAGTNAQFRLPSGVARDASGRLYVADTVNYTLRRLTPSGTDWMVATIAGIPGIYGGFVDGSDAIAEFNYPYGLTLDESGVIYVADWGNSAIRKVEASGSGWMVTTLSGFTGIAGTNDGPAGTAGFWNPAGIAVDPQGSLYVTDQSNCTIRKMAREGTDWTVTTIGGAPLVIGTADGVGSAARFRKPWGIVIDSAGTLFIADYSNHTIRMGTLPTSPRLQYSRRDRDLILSWSTNAAGYVLETAGALSPNPTWAALTNGVSVSAGNFCLTNRLDAPAGLFRLRRP